MHSLTLLLIAFVQAQGVDEAVRRWKEDDPAAREAASREIVRRWKEWTEPELAKLALAAKSSDGEVAARAGEAQAQVLRRRGFGEKLWPKIEKADALLAGLKAGGERAQLGGWSIPGGPMFHSPPAVKDLLALGEEIEPYLRFHLADREVRNEVALVLSQTGGAESLPALIEAIPPADGLDYTCVVYALWRLTHQSIGIHSRMLVGWSPDVQAQWRRWYEERKDHLFGKSGSVSLDVEAWVLGRTTKEYRKDHPWIPFEQIKEPQEGADYERRLREYCVSFLLRSLWTGGRFDTDVLMILGEVDDSRALMAIRRLAREPADPNSTPAWLAWALRSKAPETLPDLERLLAATVEKEARYVRIPMAWARLDQKLGPGRLSGRVEGDEALLLQECLEEGKGIPDLIGRLKVAEPDEGVIEIAGFVKHEGITAVLKSIRDAPAGDALRRIQAATALGRAGDAQSLRFLRESLAHEKPSVRLGAAEGLWRLANREGLKTLLSLLETRPLKDGRESSGTLTIVPPARTSSLYVVRRSCELLGEMGDPSAIEPLKKLQSENLNGFMGMAAASVKTGWYGRPDAVALARLGDLSGMDRLLAGVRNGDPLGAAGDYGRPGDLVEIGLKRYARDLVPLLAATGHERKDIYAARAILSLLDHGK